MRFPAGVVPNSRGYWMCHNIGTVRPTAERVKAKMLLLFLLCSVCPAVHCSNTVIHEETVTATEGSNVSFPCQLKEDRDVLQVTWQKDTGDLSGNMATYSKSHGQKFIDPYTSYKVSFSRAELNITTITLNSVNIQDEGCYKCIFNVFPTGSIFGRTCLRVYVVSFPKLETHHVWNVEKETVVSCSATGKPAPEITWNLTENFEGKPQYYFIVNANQTTTVISNFTYIPERFTQDNIVACVLRHPALNVEIALPTVTEKQHGETASAQLEVIIPVCLSVVVLFLLLGVILWWKRHAKRQKKLCGNAVKDKNVSACSGLLPR